MVGFSLAHSGLAVLMLAPFAGAAWAIGALSLTLFRKSWQQRFRLALIVVYCLLVLLMFVPYGFWQRLLVQKHAHGLHVGEYVSYAAAAGDLATVKAFLAQGVAVDVRSEDNGATPLHGAAVEGQIAVMEYLLSQGADVNALNSHGDSPLENAVSSKHADAAELLRAHGGRQIRGSDAQRDQGGPERP